MNSTYAVRELVESGRSGWVARGLAGPTSDMLKVMALDFGWRFREVVLAEISTESQLMEVLARQLELPDYFGRNWDALDECLADLSDGVNGVILRLKAVKETPEALGRILLDILNDHVQGAIASFIIVVDPPLPVFNELAHGDEAASAGEGVHPS